MGPKDARVFVIGEAPGAVEARTRKPFQGEAGRLLRKELQGVGIDPEEIYITNMVGCRPPENRTPKSSELKACRPYLEEEIREVNPEYVILLGATALKFIKGKGITEQRGKLIQKGERKYYPMFHPAAALRDPGKIPALKDDLSKFAKILGGRYKEPLEIEWSVITRANVKAFFDELKKCQEFSFDTETTGLFQQDPQFRVNCFSCSLDTGSTWVLPVGLYKGSPQWPHEILKRVSKAAENKRIVAHNGKFDNISLMVEVGVRFPVSFDTILASHIFDENSPHDLKFLSRIHCGAPDYDDLTIKQKQGQGVDLMKLYKYAAYDAYYTLQLKRYYWDKFRRIHSLRRLFYKLMMPASRIFEEIDSSGLYINLKKFEETRKSLKQSLERSLGQLEALSRSRKKINWNSPSQVADILFNRFGIAPKEFTPHGKPSTSESALIDLKGSHPLVDKLLEYRGHQKFLSTYIEGWEKLMVGNYLYLSTNLIGTVTGRFSSRLHQVPRDGTIRNLIDAPEPWVFCCADFSQIEMRLSAHASDDMRMKLIFQTGGDIHLETASSVLGVTKDKISKTDRKKAKAVGFGFLFGMWWKKFKKYAKEKYNLDLTDEQAQQFRERFFEIYSGLPKWHQRVKRQVREDGYVQYLSGRLRRLPGVYSSDKEVRGEAERQAINAPIQGFGSGDLKVMALIAVWEKFRDTGWLKLKGEVHDSILMWIRRDKLSQVLPQVKYLMENPPLFKIFKIELSVPLVVDIEIGPWGAGQKWDG